jgi:ferritin-like metal-binding protein YciE
MTTESIDELLLQGLQEMYYTEQHLVDALETMAEQSQNEDAKSAFSEHQAETEGQVDRLERVFDQLGEEPTEMEDAVVQSMLTEHEQFAGENEGEILERYNMELGQKTEHYEIASYGSLASLAEKTGHDEAAEMLVQTMEEEQAALETVTEISERYDEQQLAGN